jgi:PleD family two-component response regulator
LAADTSVKTVIDRSDVALYRAKEAGRNRVELASDASIH